MNSDIEQAVKECVTCLEYQHSQPHERPLHYKIPWRPCEVFSTDILMVNNKTFLCIIHYYRKFLSIRKVANLSEDYLVTVAKLIFTGYGLNTNIF